MLLLPLASEPYAAPTDRDLLPSERREFVRTHRTCVFGHRRRNDGPAMSIVYYIPTDTDELLVSTMAGRGKARVIERDPPEGACAEQVVVTNFYGLPDPLPGTVNLEDA